MSGDGIPPVSTHSFSAHFVWKPEAYLCRDSKATQRIGQASPTLHALLQGHLLLLPDGNSDSLGWEPEPGQAAGWPRVRTAAGAPTSVSKGKTGDVLCPGGKHSSSGPVGPWCNPSHTPSPDCTQLGSLVH